MRPEGKTGATEAGAAEVKERTSAGAAGLRCTTTVFGCTTKGTNKATIAGVATIVAERGSQAFLGSSSLPVGSHAAFFFSVCGSYVHSRRRTADRVCDEE